MNFILYYLFEYGMISAVVVYGECLGLRQILQKSVGRLLKLFALRKESKTGNTIGDMLPKFTNFNLAKTSSLTMKKYDYRF